MDQPMKRMEGIFSCKETTQLLSEALDYPLPCFQQVGLEAHLSQCEMCRKYGQQLKLLQQTFRKMSEPLEERRAMHLPEEAKHRIKRDIEQCIQEKKYLVETENRVEETAPALS